MKFEALLLHQLKFEISRKGQCDTVCIMILCGRRREAVTFEIVSGRKCAEHTAQSVFTKISAVCQGEILCEACLLHWKEFVPQINQQLVPLGFISERASFGGPCPSDNPSLFLSHFFLLCPTARLKDQHELKYSTVLPTHPADWVVFCFKELEFDNI